MEAESEHNTINRKKLYRFAYARITLTVLLALLSVGLCVSVANDLYAFVKPDREVSLTVTEPQSLEQWATLLKKSGVIQNPTVFRWYVERQGKSERIESFSGTMILNESMSYREILRSLAEQSQ